MSELFVRRPIFAFVIAIMVVLLGLGALHSLPIAQYPDIAPPQVNIRASYPGASAATLETSVTQVIEQQLTGIDGLLYFSSTSSSRGRVSIAATFEKGTDPDIAQVQVQNKVQQALPRLPQQVQQQGLVVTKSNPDSLMVVAIYDKSRRSTSAEVGDYMVSNLQDPLARIEGVGEVNVFGSQFAMRIWLDPHKLAAFALIPDDVISAIQAQNAEVAAGEVGAVPSPPGQMLDAIVTAQSRLSTPAQFADIVVKAMPDGSVIHLRDVARIELGQENYGFSGLIDQYPGVGMGINLSPGADALATADLVKAAIAEHAKDFPAGYEIAYPQDSTVFITRSLHDVTMTLGAAVILVVMVMFFFLQSWRATLIPAISVPVVLLGTLAVLSVAGFSINTLTLFAMVLAIGLLVDDAIVVVENVERLLAENPGMSTREATIRSMKQIQIALVAIAMVLSAVFLPMAFFGGSTGVIYRQFSLTIVSAMTLSVLVALILSPALTSTLLLRREDEDHAGLVGRLTGRMRIWFDRNFARLVDWYRHRVVVAVNRKRISLILYGLVVALFVGLFLNLPTGFLPNEDQGSVSLQFNLPSGATFERTLAAQQQVVAYFDRHEKKNVLAMLTFAGAGGATSGQNTGRGFISLVNWDDRPGKENTAQAIARRASRALSGLRDVEFFATVPPSVRGLGQSAGFTAELLNATSMPRPQFERIEQQILAEARADPRLQNVRLTSLPDQPTLKVSVDNAKLAVLGLSQSAVNATLATAWGGRYVNDFNDRGRVKRVFVQGDGPYRAAPEDLAQWQVRGANGQMVPFSAFSTISWGSAPTSTSRFNGTPNFEFNGEAAPGTSSGEAMDIFEAIASKHAGVSVAWAGVSFQERLSTGQAPILYGISLIVVFLCLAALYESWSIPFAVLLVIPIGLVGAVVAVTLRGLENDVYLQIGLLTTMGLAAKNAILMIEFAEQAERQGMGIMESALEAARIRLKPILMTSSSFICGVLPLALASGAGANSRIAIGTAVIGGMLTATVLAIFYIPLFFILVRLSTRKFRQWKEARKGRRGAASHGEPA